MLYLLVLIIALGLVLIGVAIKLGSILLNKQFLFNSTEDKYFTIENSGTYEIWAQAPIFRINNLGRIKPSVKRLGKDIPLKKIFLRTTISGFSNGRVNLYYFNAEPGVYEFYEIDGSSLLQVENCLIKGIFNLDKVSNVTFLIKKKVSIAVLFGFVWSIILSFVCILLPVILGLIYLLQ